MNAMFQRIADNARRSVERVHGVPVVVRPIERASPNGRVRAASATRPAYETAACFHEDSMLIVDERVRPTAERGERMMHRAPQVKASIRLSDSTKLRTGDLIERPGDGRWFEITEINPDGLGGAMVTLAAADALETP